MNEDTFIEFSEDVGYASAVVDGTQCNTGCFFWGIDFGYLYPGQQGYACCEHFERGLKVGEAISKTERLKTAETQ